MSTSKPIVVYSLLGVNLACWIFLEITGGSQDPANLRSLGAITFFEISRGEYWRLVTGMFLHIGPAHLAVNCLSLLIMGGIVERIFGNLRFAVLYLCAGLGGSAFSYAMIPALSVGAGASGAIFGCLGALGGFFLLRRRDLGELGRQNLNAVLILAGINFVFGFIIPGIDNWAHLGGFIIGGLVGIGLVPPLRGVRRPISGTIGKESRSTANTSVYRIYVSMLAAFFVFAIAIWIGNGRLY